MAYTWSEKDKGKTRATTPDMDMDGESGTSTGTPRTPHRRPRPALSTPKNRSTNLQLATPKNRSTNLQLATPSTSTVPSTPSSKRTLSQSRLTDYSFSSNKKLKPIPFSLLSNEEKKADREIKSDTMLLIREIEKEEREAKKAKKKAEDDAVKAAKAADRQRKHDERLAAELEKLKREGPSKRWAAWRTENQKTDATFELPESYDRGSYRITRECREEFRLTPADLKCLHHCLVPNTINKDWRDERWYRLGDVERLVWRKEAMLAGIECIDEEDLIANGKDLFVQRQTAEDK